MHNIPNKIMTIKEDKLLIISFIVLCVCFIIPYIIDLIPVKSLIRQCEDTFPFIDVFLFVNIVSGLGFLVAIPVFFIRLIKDITNQKSATIFLSILPILALLSITQGLFWAIMIAGLMLLIAIGSLIKIFLYLIKRVLKQKTNISNIITSMVHIFCVIVFFFMIDAVTNAIADKLLLEADAIYTQCNKNALCPKTPDGFIKSPFKYKYQSEYSVKKDEVSLLLFDLPINIRYKTNSKSFELKHQYGIDEAIFVTGGVNIKPSRGWKNIESF